MGFKQHISRTWQMIEQQVNDVPFRPDVTPGLMTDNDDALRRSPTHDGQCWIKTD